MLDKEVYQAIKEETSIDTKYADKSEVSEEIIYNVVSGTMMSILGILLSLVTVVGYALVAYGIYLFIKGILSKIK